MARAQGAAGSPSLGKVPTPWDGDTPVWAYRHVDYLNDITSGTRFWPG